MIYLNCSACNERLCVANDKAGKLGKCPACGQRVPIPLPTDSAPQTGRTVSDEEAQPQLYAPTPWLRPQTGRTVSDEEAGKSAKCPPLPQQSDKATQQVQPSPGILNTPIFRLYVCLGLVGLVISIVGEYNRLDSASRADALVKLAQFYRHKIMLGNSKEFYQEGLDATELAQRRFENEAAFYSRVVSVGGWMVSISVLFFVIVSAVKVAAPR